MTPIIPKALRIAGVIALVLIILIGITIGWFLRNSFLRPYSSETLRLQWTADGTLHARRLWTSEVLDGTRGPSNWPTTQSPFVHTVHLVRDGNDHPIAIAFEMGGADNHHGLMIGRRPEGFIFPIRAEWEEGVWWYDEVPRLDARSHRRLVGGRR